jgi:hypothetical protein
MQGVRADITSIKATQSDHGELLKDMATKADIAALKATQDERFSKIEAIQAEILVFLKQQRPDK